MELQYEVTEICLLQEVLPCGYIESALPQWFSPSLTPSMLSMPHFQFMSSLQTWQWTACSLAPETSHITCVHQWGIFNVLIDTLVRKLCMKMPKFIGLILALQTKLVHTSLVFPRVIVTLKKCNYVYDQLSCGWFICYVTRFSLLANKISIDPLSLS